ncbi:MAG: phosphoesterase [Desulfuromonas sp.]|nr:MAG: phosphoesterase [Desulfuromonas sp.]
MIDWHCHLLPGIDDGASSLDETLAMAALLAEVGYTTVCCTPHRLRGMYDTDPELMRNAVAEATEALKRERVELELWPGMEYCLDEFFADDFGPDPITLGETKRVLVETPAHADPQLLRENIFYLVRHGYTPIFAHPERHAFLAPPGSDSGSMFNRVKSWAQSGSAESTQSINDTLLAELQVMGCEFQGNLGSVGGYYGSLVKKQEKRFREAGLYSCYGSDGHDLGGLQSFLTQALNEVRLDHSGLL